MRKGFTLTEIMVVIVVIAIIASIAIPNFSRISLNNKIAKSKAGLSALQVAVENYYLFNQRSYPETLDQLTKANPSVVKTIPADPFSDTTYGYHRSPSGKNYVIFSVGPEGNGSASVGDPEVLTEHNGSSCIYVSNVREDNQP